MIRHLVLASAAALAAASAAAQTPYPVKPVSIVVPFAVGGGTDLLARFWGAVLQKELGQPIVYDLKPGAGGIIGTRFVAQAVPDGYTLLIATPAFALNPFLFKDAGYDPVRDFQAIAITGLSPIAIVVPNGSPIKSLQELLDAARAKPGQLSVSNAGTGSVGQMAAAYFQAFTGVKFTEIPYKGAAPALVDLIGGRVDAQFEAFPSVLSFIKAGKVRAIAVTPRQRSPLLPETPTADESGARGYEASSWTGFMAPARTPRPILEQLNAAFRRALTDPDVIARLAAQFGSDPGRGSVDEAAAYVAAKFKENASLVRASGIVPQ